MKNFYARFIAVLLIVLLITTSVGCASNSSVVEDITSIDGNITTAEEEVDLYANVPKENFDGQQFHIYSSTCTWALYALNSEGMNGEILNDTIYERNQKVNEHLNVELVYTETDSMYSSAKIIQQLVLANDATYDICYLSTYMAAPYATDNIFVDIYSIDSIHLEEPWWNKRSIPYYELDGKLYWAHGDASIHYYDSMWTVFFNKKMIDDMNLEDPYTYVENGNWTIDTFTSMVHSASVDLDGNGIIEDSDQFGLTTHGGSTLGFLHGMDERAIDIVDGIPFAVQPDERMYDVMEKIQNLFADKSVRTANDDDTKLTFVNNQALFLIETMGNASWLREMNADFGIIPFPKYDEEQNEYHSYISPGSISVQIPVTNADAERTGIVVEVLNALSYESIRPAYLNVVLGQKYMRDEKSLNTMELMLRAAECELAFVYRWADYQNTFIDGLSSNRPMASEIASKINTVENAISDFVGNLQ